MNVVVITPPAEEPITLTEAKSHLRVDVTDDDALIASMLTAARQICETFHGRAYITRTLEAQLDSFPTGAIELPRPPLDSIISVKYTDTDGIVQTLDSAAYEVSIGSDPGIIRPASGYSWPATDDVLDAVKIQYTAGYGAAADVPERIKIAIKLQLADLYEYRESVVLGAIPSRITSLGAEALLWPDRFWSIG